MGTGSQTAPTQTTTTQLTPEQQQLMGVALPGLMNFAANPPKSYSGQTVADFTPAQKAAQDQALQAATAQSQTAASGTGAENFYTGGQVWDPTYNPALQGAVDAAVRPIQENLVKSTLPALRNSSDFVGTNFGSSRQALAEQGATELAGKQIGDTSKQVIEDLYKTNQAAQLQALGLLPTVQAAQVQPALTTGAVGDTQQAQAQNIINAQIAKYNYDQWAPFLTSAELASIAGSLPGGGTTSTANVPPPPPGWKQALAGAGTGAATGAALGSIVPGVGTAIGAGVGGVAGGVLPFLMHA